MFAKELGCYNVLFTGGDAAEAPHIPVAGVAARVAPRCSTDISAIRQLRRRKSCEVRRGPFHTEPEQEACCVGAFVKGVRQVVGAPT